MACKINQEQITKIKALECGQAVFGWTRMCFENLSHVTIVFSLFTAACIGAAVRRCVAFTLVCWSLPICRHGSASGRSSGLKPPSSPNVRRGSPKVTKQSLSFKGSPKSSPQRSMSLDSPEHKMRHLDFGAMPNFNSGSGRVKAQGHLRGKLPFGSGKST